MGRPLEGWVALVTRYNVQGVTEFVERIVDGWVVGKEHSPQNKGNEHDYNKGLHYYVVHKGTVRGSMMVLMSRTR